MEAEVLVGRSGAVPSASTLIVADTSRRGCDVRSFLSLSHMWRRRQARRHARIREGPGTPTKARHQLRSLCLSGRRARLVFPRAPALAAALTYSGRPLHPSVRVALAAPSLSAPTLSAAGGARR
eukprot:scaffold4457_cov94-Isochrysis_galbana.AAC.3